MKKTTICLSLLAILSGCQSQNSSTAKVQVSVEAPDTAASTNLEQAAQETIPTFEEMDFTIPATKSKGVVKLHEVKGKFKLVESTFIYLNTENPEEKLAVYHKLATPGELDVANDTIQWAGSWSADSHSLGPKPQESVELLPVFNISKKEMDLGRPLLFKLRFKGLSAAGEIQPNSFDVQDYYPSSPPNISQQIFNKIPSYLAASGYYYGAGGFEWVHHGQVFKDGEKLVLFMSVSYIRVVDTKFLRSVLVPAFKMKQVYVNSN